MNYILTFIMKQTVIYPYYLETRLITLSNKKLIFSSLKNPLKM